MGLNFTEGFYPLREARPDYAQECRQGLVRAGIDRRTALGRTLEDGGGVDRLDREQWTLMCRTFLIQIEEPIQRQLPGAPFHGGRHFNQRTFLLNIQEKMKTIL